MFADGVAGFELQCFVDPCVLLDHGFFIDEDGTQLPVFGQGGNDGAVHVAIVGAEPIEHFGDDRGGNGGVKFVRFQSKENGVLRSQLIRRRRGKAREVRTDFTSDF